MPSIKIKTNSEKLLRWFARNFQVLTVEKAKQLNLKPCYNLPPMPGYTEKTKSIWIDEKSRSYRVNCPIDFSNMYSAGIDPATNEITITKRDSE